MEKKTKRPKGEAQAVKPRSELEKWKSKFATLYGPNIITKANIYPRHNHISMGAFILDVATGGGLPQGHPCTIFGWENQGKCHAAGTRILMYDGTTCVVEDIQPGSLVMGVDSKPRKVLRTLTGHGPLFTVKPRKSKGDEFVVNADHQLSLKCMSSHGRHRKGTVLTMSVADYMRQSKQFKKYHGIYRVGVEFDQRFRSRLTLEPYFLGLWLGDGTSEGCGITTADTEVREYLEGYADRRGVRCVDTSSKNRTPTYALRVTKDTPHADRLPSIERHLRDLGLRGNKHIPHRYKIASKTNRLSLLAGLLDSDGHSLRSGHYEFTSTNKRLADDTAFLARSLGFYACVSEGVATLDGVVIGAKYRVVITGDDLASIPVRIRRKKAHKKKRAQQLATTFDVVPCGSGHYYGFTLDGDKLYMLDSFIVNHNTTEAMKCVAEFQRKQKVMGTGRKALWVAMEEFDPLWAAVHGVDTADLELARPDSGEQAVDIINGMSRVEEIGMIVLDSIANLISMKMAEASAEDIVMAHIAKLAGPMCSKLSQSFLVERKRGHFVTFIGINQWRYKMTMFGDPRVLPGGTQTNFFHSTKIEIKNKEKLGKDRRGYEVVERNMHSFEIKKAKVNSMRSGEFEMVLHDSEDFRKGDIDDAETISAFAIDYGFIEGKKKLYFPPFDWTLDGQEDLIQQIRSVAECRTWLAQACIAQTRVMSNGLPAFPKDTYLYGSKRLIEPKFDFEAQTEKANLATQEKAARHLARAAKKKAEKDAEAARKKVA